MANSAQEAEPIALPPLPVDHADWISYASANPNTPMHELIAPYKDYDSKLRQIYAQQPKHPAVSKSNVVPIFTGSEDQVKIRARSLQGDPELDDQHYLMPLSTENRKPNGAPAVVSSLNEFKSNFQVFSESSLVDMDWSNVVVAGSAVVTSLLPVPAEHGTSKRALREYYHQKLAPASDIDLFLYDLTEEQAIEKIKQIERCVKDSILAETTTIRTKNAITIASKYPNRHIQIVLRIYRSISEILTGFDVDCSCAAYDGKQVYASPRALAAYMTQINTIDLTRRSPSYENRLSKYSRRGFEVYWPQLDRSRIDPTIFERSFGRTLGLARLLVLEKLPKASERQKYVDQRREERGRPKLNPWSFKKEGNIKEEYDDEVGEWVEADEGVSDYHTFTLPYGPKYHARKIEKILFGKDLLLNAEWNRPKERETALHRHPAFFGDAADVIEDCCGHCPKPVTPEDKEIAETEGKTFVSGKLTFIKDDPGRQAIGSFNPLTDDDWTEMAYVGNTARLCQAIVDGDLEHVQDWLKQEGADPNRRDYTGRTPLHLAVMVSTPEIVQCLIDGGARITARIVDGKTSLHLAAMRGQIEIVKSLLIKSEANEEIEAEKEEVKRKERAAAGISDVKKPASVTEASDNDMTSKAESEDFDEDMSNESGSDGEEDEDIDMLDDDSSTGDATTERSMVRVDRKKALEASSIPDDAGKDEPDVYDVNVLAWDMPVSALHLAIAHGHTELVKVLVQDFGADVLLPVKLLHYYDKSPRAAIMPLVLALQLEAGKAKEMTKALINLGASPAQADMEQITVLHYFTTHGADLLTNMTSADQPAARRAVNHVAMKNYQYHPDSPSALRTAVEHGDVRIVDHLLELGAKPEIDFADWITSYKGRWTPSKDADANKQKFQKKCQQPIFAAITCELPSIVLKLLEAGADVNSVCRDGWSAINDSYGSNKYRDDCHSVLDAVREKIEKLRDFAKQGLIAEDDDDFASVGQYDQHNRSFKPVPPKNDHEYLQGIEPGSYAHWLTLRQVQIKRVQYERDLKRYNESIASHGEPGLGTSEKKVAVSKLLAEFEALEKRLVELDAKTFPVLHPTVKLLEGQRYKYNFATVKQPEEWSPKLTFRLPDLTDERREAYMKLFQACWVGDLTTVKELTLMVWGNSQSPLQVAVQDSNNFSPFSIAVLRKHIDVAKAILDIAHAQYEPEKKAGQWKSSLRQPYDCEESEYDSDEQDDDDRFKLYVELINDQFTVEDIGQVQSQVKSKVTPLEMLSWQCPAYWFLEDREHYPSPWGGSAYASQKSMSPKSIKLATNDGEVMEDSRKPNGLFQFAIYLDDPELFQFLMTNGEEYTLRKDKADDETTPHFFRFSEQDFLYAVRLGRLRLLEQIVKKTGAGIPLDDLVKKSGVTISEKPKYYQGLSVHGKKREDWAHAHHLQKAIQKQDQHPPTLQSARLGSLESVEWFSSEAVLRYYSEFAENHQSDVRIQNLAKAEGGIAAAISKWLGLRQHLLLHCVVLGETTSESLSLLRHCCKTRPELLQQKSLTGMTPLQLAFSLHRVEMIKVLLEAGADQTCRNTAGDNILHSMLSGHFKDPKKHASRIRELLSLVDPRLLPSLFAERTYADPGAATPLAKWLFASVAAKYAYYISSPNNITITKDIHQILAVILDFSKGEDLSFVNSEGDTPLHAAIRYGAHDCLRTMLECRPDLLHRENATGRTPYEMSQDIYFSTDIFSDPPRLSATDEGSWDRPRVKHVRTKDDTTPILTKEPKLFSEGFVPEDNATNTARVWAVCTEFANKPQSNNMKRKLVSLVEANEVAKRLEFKKLKDEAKAKREEEEKKGNEKPKDEVDTFFEAALKADEKVEPCDCGVVH